MIINGFPADDSVSVRKAQDVLREDTLEGDLAYLCSNFTFLADTIKSLESAGETLARNVGLISKVQELVDDVRAGPAAVQVRSKLQSVLSKNSGFSVLKEVSKVLSGEHSRVPEGVEALNISKHKYAPLTSVDVERSFSAYKLVLSDKRQKFEPKNLEMVLVFYCFHNFSHCF
ncbi:uncharacterized protein LOC120841655 [Ixodes scapularis]|uniref:uncharacterized protein LOC120841655 n=1 Tax=Ixodes scapularis TaxID=6945 RepID=UPI001A9E33F7|nr:uncharacterized protein LOC120841655 [Ixodes scapularis]